MADERGSVIGVANGSGSVTTVNAYDAYGVPDSGNDGRFQYTGQIWLDDVELYHYKARTYDPELGRFLQTDPIGISGGVNIYAYVGNDPVSFSDPSGLCRQMLESVLDSYRARHDSRPGHYLQEAEIEEALETVVVWGTTYDTSVDCPDEFEDFYSDDDWMDFFVDRAISLAYSRYSDAQSKLPALNLVQADAESPRLQCLHSYYGDSYDVAWNVSPLSVPSLIMSGVTESMEDQLRRKGIGNLYGNARSGQYGLVTGRQYAAGQRQMRTLAQFRRFNLALLAAGVGATGFIGGANIQCTLLRSE